MEKRGQGKTKTEGGEKDREAEGWRQQRKTETWGERDEKTLKDRDRRNRKAGEGPQRKKMGDNSQMGREMNGLGQYHLQHDVLSP